MMSEKSSKCPPPWQVLNLVAAHLDPKTLAMASCVSKPWYTCMSSDHLWQPTCSTLYPSLSNLHGANPTISYRRLFILGHLSNERRQQKPPKPHLSLDSIIFAIDIYNSNSCLSTTIKHGGQLHVDKNNVFRFDIDVDDDEKLAVIDTFDSLRITWNVVLKGFKSVFTMMDCKGKGSFILRLEGWFSKELPVSGCCWSSADSGLVADLRLGLKESCGKVTVEKMSVGVLSIVSWRYVSVEDALRYMEHFLLPCLIL